MVFNQLSNFQIFTYRGYQVTLNLEKAALLSDKKTWSVRVEISSYVYSQIAQIAKENFPNTFPRNHSLLSTFPRSLSLGINYSDEVRKVMSLVPYHQTFQIVTKVGGFGNTPSVNAAIRKAQELIDRECGDVTKRFEFFFKCCDSTEKIFT